MKIHIVIATLLILFFSACQKLNAKESKYCGRVIDQKSGTPIAGVYLMIGDYPVTVSNENGYFELTCDTTVNRVLVFYHFAYDKKSMVLADLNSNTLDVEMTEKSFELDEVSITGISLQNLIKKAHKQFAKKYHPYEYWFESSYREYANYNGKPLDYFECAGALYVPEKKSILISNLFRLVPIEIRRTRTSMFQSIYNEKERRDDELLRKRYFNGFNVKYTLMEKLHPLSNYNFKNFVFKMDTSFYRNDVIVIDFMSKKDVQRIKGAFHFYVNSSFGKLWINRKTFMLERIEFSWSYGKKSGDPIDWEISYYDNETFLYPTNIKCKEILMSKQNGCFRESELELKNPTPAQGQYWKTEKYPYFSIYSVIEDYPYHQQFWEEYPLTGKWDRVVQELSKGDPVKEFTLGAQDKIIFKEYLDKHYYKCLVGDHKKTKFIIYRTNETRLKP